MILTRPIEFLLFSVIFFSIPIWGQEGLSLHDQVFGKRKKQFKQLLSFDVFVGDEFYGPLRAWVEDEQISSFDPISTLSVFEKILAADAWNDLNGTQLIDKSHWTGIGVSYQIDWAQFRLIFSIPTSKRKSQVTIVRNTKPDWANNEKNPASNSMILNYQLQRDEGHQVGTVKKNSGNFDFGYNYHSFVLEGRLDYADNRLHEWKRGNIRLVHDVPDEMVRYQLGEVDYQISGYQSFRPLTGVAVNRNFTLNPYRIITPLNQKEFFLEERSFVTVMVNNRIVKNDFFAPGKHSLTDLPLVAGLNDIKIKVIDSRGREKIIEYRQVTSTDLLTKNLETFHFAGGRLTRETATGRQVIDDNSHAFSFDYLRGWSTHFTSGGWAQLDQSQQVVGLRGVLATYKGNYSFDFAKSRDKNSSLVSQSYKIGYAFLHNGFGVNESVRTTLTFENQGTYFVQWGQQPSYNSYDYRARINNSLIINDHFLLNFGASYLRSRKDDVLDKFGQELGTNHRLWSNTQLNILGSNTRMDNGQWEKTIAIFININFPDSNQYVNSSWDSFSQLSRTQWRRQSPQNINALNGGMAVSKGASGHESYEADGEYRSNLADVRAYVRNDGQYTNGFAQLNGAIVMADNHWGVSRPVPGSFALIVPKDNLRGQKLALSSYSQYREGQNLGEKRLIINNLVPYHYQRFMIDTTLLDPGVALEEEMFVLSPGYKTGHLLQLGSSGRIILMAKLLCSNDGPCKLKTGHLRSLGGVSYPFFTNKNGMFMVENIGPGNYELILDDEIKAIKLEVPINVRGIYKAGSIRYE